MTDSGDRRRCPCCGHFGSDATCLHCGGQARDLTDAPRPLRRGRGWWPADFVRGASTALASTGPTLHHRAFVGRLRLPVATNAVAAATLAGAAWLLWSPLVEVFAGTWPVLDGWRELHRHSGPVTLSLATIWLLWPVWFEVVAGAAIEPLVEAAEVAIGGAGMRTVAAPGVGDIAARVHRRARLLAVQILLLPIAWLIALLPFVGMPLLFLGSAALAAATWLELPAERRGFDGHRHLADLRRNWPRALGYGAALQMLVLVPLLNLFLLAAIGAVGAAQVHFQFVKTASAAGPPGARAERQ